MTISYKPTYSICMTNYNTVHSVRQSLESLLSQVDERFEIIVVDNQSDDGSLDILRYYEKMGRIRLIIRRCSIGLGRQIGVRNSKGKYIISQMDMDDVFEPCLNQLLELYHVRFEGCLLLVQGQPGMIIGPKELIDKVGGYRDLNYLEDRDLCSRVAQIGLFRFLKSFRIVAYTVHHPNRKYRSLIRIKKSFLEFREAFRTGRGPMLWRRIGALRAKNRVRAIGFPGLLIIAIMGFITHWFYPRYHNKFIRLFNRDDYIIEL